MRARDALRVMSAIRLLPGGAAAAHPGRRSRLAESPLTPAMLVAVTVRMLLHGPAAARERRVTPTSQQLPWVRPHTTRRRGPTCDFPG